MPVIAPYRHGTEIHKHGLLITIEVMPGWICYTIEGEELKIQNEVTLLSLTYPFEEYDTSIHRYNDYTEFFRKRLKIRK
jgi:hypothetical protein